VNKGADFGQGITGSRGRRPNAQNHPNHHRSLARKASLVSNYSAVSQPLPPSQSAEDYLERIHELIEEKGYARVVDIASSLEVKQASVTSMVQKLGELGYLVYEKYRGLILTPKGLEVACRIRNRHETLSRFFSLLGLDPKTQRHDIEGIEHHLSPATVEMLDSLAMFFENHPDILQRFLQSRNQREA
jgi:Mn-dependent DtxR family transcriptional regulator